MIMETILAQFNRISVDSFYIITNNCIILTINDFVGFEEAVNSGISFGAGEEHYLDAHKISREKAGNAVKRHTQSYQKYYLRERRLGSLILL